MACSAKTEKLKVIDLQIEQLKRKRDECSDEAMRSRYERRIKVLGQQQDDLLLGDDDDE